MIGTELLNLMYGNPYNQMAGAMAPTTAPTPTPNVTPKPGAPPTLQTPPPNKPPYWDPTGSVVRNMGPVSQPGAGGSPSPAPGTASGPPASGGAPTAQTPPAAQASPPDLAQLYFQLQNRNRSANEIDRGLSLMAASVSTPSMANAIMGSVGRGEQQQDPGQMLGQLMQMRYMQQMMNMPAPGSGGGGTAGGAGGGISIDPEVWKAMPPDARAKMLSDIATSQIGVQTQKQESINKDVQEFKNSGIQDFSAADQKLRESEAGVNQLLKDMPSTMAALSYPDLATTSKWAAWNPLGPSDAVKQQAIAIQKLEAGLTGESLQNVKNVRNQREFSTLGEALTAGLNANNGPQGVQDALNAIKQKMAVAHANVYATAGKEIPNQYSGMADPSYTSATLNGQPNPYFTGATYEPAPKGAPAAPGFDYGAIKSGDTYTAPDGTIRRKS